MSFKMLAWAQDVRTGSSSTKAVLMALCAIINDDGEGYPSQQRIADESELSIRTVKRAMDDLESAGYISRERRYREGGYRTSDSITVHKTPQILGVKLSGDTESGDTVSNLRCHSGIAEPVIEPVIHVVRARAGDLPIEEKAFQDWNTLAQDHSLPKVQKITAARRKHLKARLVDCGGLDGWNACLSKIRGSPFLLGKQSDWRCDFDFVVSESGFTKIMEGKYDARLATHQSKHPAPSDTIAEMRSRIAEERSRLDGISSGVG